MDGVSCGIDWISGTFPIAKVGDYIGLCEFWFGEASPLPAGKSYAIGVGFDNGGRVYWDDGSTGREPRPEAFLELKGDACSSLSANAAFELLAALRMSGDWGSSTFRATRIDCRIDDTRESRMTVDRFRLYSASGRYSGLHANMGVVERGAAGGGSEYFGQRGKWGSGRQFVVYDKAAESGGAIAATRFEARFFKKKAPDVFEVLSTSSSVERLEKECGALVVGAMKFFDDDAKKVPAAFWVEMEGFVGKMKIASVAKPAPDALAMLLWVEKQASAAIYTAFEFLSRRDGKGAAEHWLLGLVAEGERRAGRRHKLALGDPLPEPPPVVLPAAAIVEYLPF